MTTDTTAVAPSPESPTRNPTLHVGAYNHRGGGVDAGSYDRLEAQLDLIAPLGLDVLFSTEAKYWFDHGRHGLHLAARRLGMQPLWVRAPRHDCNLVIFIRTERLRVVQERHEQGHPWWHAQARAVVTVDGSDEPLWLAAAHFAPFNPDIRLAEARAISELGDRLTIMGGDWNDGGIGDLPTDLSALPGCRVVRHAEVHGQTAAGILAQAGFVDVGAVVLPDPHQRQPTAGIPHAPLRCDRLYVSDRLRHTPRAYQVVPDGKGLSDHRFVYAELVLGAGS